MTFTPIQTERLRIRPFRPTDWQAVHTYTSNAAIMHYLEEGQMNAEQTQAWVQQQAESLEAYAVVRHTDDMLVGHISFHKWFNPHIYELGWVMHPDHHGRGYTTEAARALLRYGFETRNIHRVIATCQPENIASWRVMEKLGMVREGHLRQCVARPNGEWWDEYFYAILKTDWETK